MLVTKKHNFIVIIISIALFAGLYLSSLYHYLLFHSIAEIFSIVVAIAIFILVWNLRQYLDNNYLLFLGISYLFIGCIDLLHTLAYKGMGIFQIYEANLSTQLWIVGRYLESISFVIATYFIERKLKANILLIVYVVMTSIMLSSIFAWHIFPVCYVEGAGLTPFKIISEYIISCILVIALFTLIRKRHAFDKKVTLFLAASIMITIVSELAFTLYTDVYGTASLIGHFFKILSFYLIYKAIVEIGIRQPFALFFRAQKEEESRKLRGAETRYKTVADFTYDWEYWEGPDGKFQYLSPSCHRITGYTQEEFIKNVELLRGIIIDEDKGIWDRHRREAHQKPMLRELQFRIKRKDGQIRWVEHACQQVKDAQGNFLGFRASNRDITERKRAQNESNHLRGELIHAARLSTMGELTAALAHELNQPLTAILSNAQAAQRFLEKKKPDLNEVRDILADIVSDDNRAKEIILKLRSLLRKVEHEFIKLDINQVIQEVIPLVRSDSVIKNVFLKSQLEKGIPFILGDRVQLQQVMVNLILNGFEAMKDADSKELCISTTQNDADTITVSIKDSGLGVDEGNVENLFKPFTTTKEGNLGMGLSISRSIIELHDGKIWVKNNSDKGATFYFSLPVNKEG